MNIEFNQVYKRDEEDFKLIAGWDNDKEIRYFIRPNFSEGEIENITPEEIIEAFEDNENKKIFMIACDNKKVGYINIDTDFNYLYKKEKKSAWIGICIGDKEYRGRGISKIAMNYLEELGKSLGINRIELGVFEYNERAIDLYKKVGYKKIGEIDDFVYYKGRWHKDIRMEKYI